MAFGEKQHEKTSLSPTLDSGVGDLKYLPTSPPRRASSKESYMQTLWGENRSRELSQLKGDLDQTRFHRFGAKGLTKQLHSLLSEEQKRREDQFIEEEEGVNRLQNFSADCRNEKELKGIVLEWTQDQDTFIVVSQTLPLDLSLGTYFDSNHAPFLTFLFIATTKKEPGLFLFALVDGNDDKRDDIDRYTVGVARRMREKLTILIPDDLPYIVSCFFRTPAFCVETIKSEVKKAWNSNLAFPSGVNMRGMFDKGPTALTDKRLRTLRAAMTSLSSLSHVPSCLCETGAAGASIYLMDTDLTRAVLGIVRGPFTQGFAGKQAVSCDLGSDSVICVILEAAKRLTCVGPVLIASEDSRISNTIRALKKTEEELQLFDTNDNNCDQYWMTFYLQTHQTHTTFPSVFCIRFCDLDQYKSRTKHFGPRTPPRSCPF